MKREKENSFRSLLVIEGLADLCSNDYLGFARSTELERKTNEEFLEFRSDTSSFKRINGSTGSRLLSGNTAYTENLEKEIAEFHKAEASLIFNSGYDANFGLISSLARRGDTVIADELAHASILDGMLMSRANISRFEHNEVKALEKLLKESVKNIPGGTLDRPRIFVVIESVYSMDGDRAPLKKIANLCSKYHANLIVDEAHATGIYGEEGRGLVCEHELGSHVFARIVTFGKALGCHGAAVIGSNDLRNYLVNFARPFIYSTALPLHSLCAIRAAYAMLKTSSDARNKLNELIGFYNTEMKRLKPAAELTEGPVKCFMTAGNAKAKRLAAKAQKAGYDVRAILSPTVPKGEERIRICLHSFNTKEEIIALLVILSG